MLSPGTKIKVMQLLNKDVALCCVVSYLTFTVAVVLTHEVKVGLLKVF